MAAQVLSFFQRSPRYAPKPTDWSQQELAEFYRVESALIRAGIRVGTDRGLSDENEPWFVFFRADDGEVVIHFARIDGEYLIAGPAYEEIARGFDFSSLVRNLVARHPLIRRSEGSNISVHPAALLVAIVGTAFFKTGEARAAETGATNAHSGHSRPTLLSSSSSSGLNGVAPMARPATYEAQIPANQAVLVLAAAMFASDFSVDAASLDPSVRTAISAAAAALDFGPVAPRPADDGVLPRGASQAQAPAPTAEQAVSSVLLLVTVLSTLPSASEAPQPTDAPLSVTPRSGGSDGGGATPPPPTGSGDWAVNVRLGLRLDGAPAVEAVQLVRTLAGDLDVQKVSVIEVAKLPDVLAQIIAKGEHYGVAPIGVTPAPEPHPTPSPVPDVSGPGVVAPPPVVDTKPAPIVPEPTPPTTGPDTTTPVTPPVTPPTQGSDVTTPTTPPSPSIPTPEPAPVQPSPPPYTGFATYDMVKTFIEYFVAHTDEVQIMSQGREIVIFDVRVTENPGAIAHLTSMTFHFFDGSAVNLVGDYSAFLHTPGLI